MPGHVSVGAGWTDVNALGVVNSAYRQVVFWNGRADSLWALNVVVAESATTMNGNRLRTAHRDREPLQPAFYRRRCSAPEFGPLDLAQIAARCPAASGKTTGTPPSFGTSMRSPDQQKMVTRILVNWAKAIAAYEYTLISGDSAFDRVRCRRARLER